MSVRRSPQKSSKKMAAKGHGAKTAAVREQAILALLSERSILDAAKRCNLSERTVRRWLAEDATFKAEYAAARAATFEAGMGRIQALVAKAVDKLDVLLDVDAPHVQLGAARTLTELGMHQRDAEAIMRKLDEIEARQQQGRV